MKIETIKAMKNLKEDNSITIKIELKEELQEMLTLLNYKNYHIIPVGNEEIKIELL